MSLGIFLVELLVWWLSVGDRVRYRQEDPITRWSSSMGRRLSRADSNGWLARVKFRAVTLLGAGNNMTFQDCVEVLFLRPCEIVNTGWLVYIVAAQTFGAYKNCDCQASTWGGHGVSIKALMDYALLITSAIRGILISRHMIFTGNMASITTGDLAPLCHVPS